MISDQPKRFSSSGLLTNVRPYFQIMPNNLKENSFWTKANDELLADDDILKGLQSKFASKPAAKKADVAENNNKNKKVGSGCVHDCLTIISTLDYAVSKLSFSTSFIFVNGCRPAIYFFVLIRCS